MQFFRRRKDQCKVEPNALAVQDATTPHMNFYSSSGLVRGPAVSFFSLTICLLLVLASLSIVSLPLVPFSGVRVQPDDSEAHIPPTVARYIAWHRQHRQCILDPSCNEPTPPIIMWRCMDPSIRPCAGIGDRLRGIRVLLAVAIVTKRLFFINWPSDPVPLTEALLPSTFDWRLPDGLAHDNWPMLNWYICPAKPLRWKQCVAPKGLIPTAQYLPNVNRSLPTMNASSDDFTRALSHEPNLGVACRASSLIANKLFQNPHYAPSMPDLQPSSISPIALQRMLLSVLFQPSDAVQSVINATLSSQFAQQDYVGVHGRAGIDFRETDPRFSYIQNHTDAAAEQLIECAQKSSPSSKLMFIAADSVSLKDKITSLANKTNIEARSIPLGSFHFGLKHTKGLIKRRSDDETWQGFVNVFADLYMLGGSQTIITTGSGFARTSYWVGKATRFLQVEDANGTEQCYPTGRKELEPPPLV